MSRFTHCCGILLLTTTGLLSFEATAVPVDLNAFTGDPEVIITPNGVSATFMESAFSAVVLLTNDPFLGDPFVIVPGAFTSLTFDFVFNEAPGDDDQFSAYLFLAQDGPISGVLDQFSVMSSQAGVVSFDLSPYVSGTELLQLGLQFELFDITGGSLNSTVAISNLALTQVVPIPAAIWLFGSGLFSLIGVARLKKA
ncbi:MAG: hypothetical protein WBN96_02420 [Gammaproteobacteria bacterium]